MAFWNAPLDDPDHAIHAVEAALAMLQALDAAQRELPTRRARAGDEPHVSSRIGVGINTGDCVVGNMGSELRFDYSALGDAVNLASRLEGESKDYGVPLLLGEQTANWLPRISRSSSSTASSVKGKTLPTRIFTVVPTADAETLALHAALLGDFYQDRLSPSDARFAALVEKLPTLAGYYGKLKHRLEK